MKALCALVAFFPFGAAWAAGPVVLVEERVPQYVEAANAAKKHLNGARTVDPGAGDVGAALSGAPVVLAVGQKALSVARAQAGGAPIVYCMVLGVPRSGLGEAETGVPLESDPSVALAQMRAVSPSAKRVGVVYNPRTSEELIKDAQKAAAAIGLALQLKPVGAATEVKDAVAGMSGSIDLLWLPPDPKLFSKELFSFLLGFSAERKVPLFGFLDSFTQSGALASLSPDYGDIGERAGKLAAEIGARPRGSPVPAPVYAPGKLTVNLKTAKALGIDVSAKALADAKQVFR